MKNIISFLFITLFFAGCNNPVYEIIVCGDDKILIIDEQASNGADVITSETFSPFEPLKTALNIKSINYFKESGKLIYTIAEESWWTFNIYIKNPDKTIHIPDIKMYKMRPLYSK